jgi:hypothetical protein
MALGIRIVLKLPDADSFTRLAMQDRRGRLRKWIIRLVARTLLGLSVLMSG